MSSPTDQEILDSLNRLDEVIADDLETYWLEFKPWTGPKSDLSVAIEYTACMANAGGGAIVFGVKNVKGKSIAVEGASRYNLDAWRRDIFNATRPNLNVEVYDLDVPGLLKKLLIVRVPKGNNPPYGTSEGLFKIRIGKNCMPLDPSSFVNVQISTGAIDWSGQPAPDAMLDDLDPLEIERAKNLLKRINPESDLLKLNNSDFLVGIGAVRGGRVTHAGLLLLGRERALTRLCPQHQVHYVLQSSDTEVSRNDSYRSGLLNILEKIEQVFTGPINPEHELTVGFFKHRIPSFPLEVIREAVLNALTHRDYSDPGEVLIRHTHRELIISSPGNFMADITPENILRHEPISRNRTLAEAFEKLRLVERAGIGRRRIFIPMLSYGKRAPVYETDGTRVILRLFDGSFDAGTAALVAKFKAEGREIDLDGLLILSYLRENSFIDLTTAARLLQLSRESARSVVDQLSNSRSGILERRGKTKAATYHLTKEVAKELLGKVAYTKIKGINPIKYAEMVRTYVSDHKSITPKECRELLGLGSSQTARVEVSRYLRRWSGKDGFLVREGKGRNTSYSFKG